MSAGEVAVETIGIVVDGLPCRVRAGSTLAQLVQALGHEPQAVGTALDGRFVPRGQREATPLRPGCAVLLFKPIVGG